MQMKDVHTICDRCNIFFKIAANMHRGVSVNECMYVVLIHIHWKPKSVKLQIGLAKEFPETLQVFCFRSLWWD